MLTKPLRSALFGCVLIITGCGVVATAVVLTHIARADDKPRYKAGKKADASSTTTSGTASSHSAAKHAAKEEKKRHALTLGAKLQPKQIEVLEIASLDEDSLAAKAGLRQKDRIISADGQEVATSRQLDAYLASQAGRRVPLLIERDGRQLIVSVVPDQIAGDTAWLGVYLEQGESKDKGARITHVYPSGPAAKAGLHVGDTVVKVDDQTVEHPADLIELVQELDPHAKVDFHLLRDKEETTLPVTLGSRADFIQQASHQNGNGIHGSSPSQEAGGNQNSSGQMPHANGGEGPFANVPYYAMQLEMERRNGEQHERLEREILALREEFRRLREELMKK